jgi:hypothetical protein
MVSTLIFKLSLSVGKLKIGDHLIDPDVENNIKTEGKKLVMVL